MSNIIRMCPRYDVMVYDMTGHQLPFHANVHEYCPPKIAMAVIKDIRKCGVATFDDGVVKVKFTKVESTHARSTATF